MRTVVATLGLALALASGAWALVRVDGADLTRTVALSVGQELSVHLTENPSTGYGWTCTVVPPGVLELVSDTPEPPPAAEGLGAPGMRHFVLAARAPGQALVTVQYGRPWAGGEQDPPRHLLVVVAALEEATNLGEPVQADETDFVPTVALASGENLVVTLPENPSTGFQWEYTEEPPAALQVRADAFYRAKVAPGIVGAGGTRRVCFQGTTPGRVILFFTYGRPWAGGEKDLPRALVVQVGEAPAAGAAGGLTP